MIEINEQLFEMFINYQSSAITAFMPIIASVAGVFLAFAIANSVRFLIQKSIKR